MKKIQLVAITICLFFNTMLNAQTEPTFEQTVDYIVKNTKGRVMYPGDLDSYSRVKGYFLKDVKIEKNGQIEFITDQKFDDNKFNIIFNIFDLVQKVDYPDGIRAYKYLVHFNGLNVSSGYGITYATDADAQKVARALRHLKTVCTKDDDLFSKPIADENKVKLTREETIDYVNKLVYFDGKEIATLCMYQKRERNEYYKYNYTSSGNLKLRYSSSDKTYSFGNFYKKYTWNNNDGNTVLYDSSEDRENQIKFKYFDFIDVESYTGSYDNKLYNLVVKFKHNENSIATRFKIYMPYWKGCDGVSFGDEKPFDVQFEKEIKKLTKAFNRLKELDADDIDPFED